MRQASGTVLAAHQGFAATPPEERLTSSLRPGVPVPDWPVVRSAEDAVRRTILELYRELGHAPRLQEIARCSDMTVERVDALLHRLAQRDLVVLEGERIVSAYPLTDRPTEHRVSVEGQRLRAMCAIDALGVGAMYGTSTVIESRCRLCRAAIDVRTVDHGRRLVTALPTSAVVFAGIGYRGGCAATSLCTTIAFFCDDAHLNQWRSAQELEGTGFRLSIEDAFQVGRAIFGPVLVPPTSEVLSEAAS